MVALPQLTRNTLTIIAGTGSASIQPSSSTSTDQVFILPPNVPGVNQVLTAQTVSGGTTTLGWSTSVPSSWTSFSYSTPPSNIPASAFMPPFNGLILSDGSSPYTLPDAVPLQAAIAAAFPSLASLNPSASFVLKMTGGGNDFITLNPGAGATLINNDNQTFTKPGILQIIFTSGTTYDYFVLTDNQP